MTLWRGPKSFRASLWFPVLVPSEPGHAAGNVVNAGNLMLETVSNAVYRELIVPSFQAAGQPFGGTAFHSCGDWSKRTTLVRQMAGVKVVDAAFSRETDPRPNPQAPFREVFAHSGIVLQARIVGSAETVADCVRQLWGPGMRLIVVTYCPTPEEQAETYRCIHDICQI